MRLNTLLRLIRTAGLLVMMAILALGLSASPTPAVAGPAPDFTGAPTFTVNSPFDVPANLADTNYSVCRTQSTNTICTLRAAIMKANRYAGGGVTINIPSGIYSLTVSPTGPNNDLSGDLNITQTVTIQGAGAGSTIIDGGGLDRLFNIQSGIVVAIGSVTIRNGSGSLGGGIFSGGSLTLTNSFVTGNRATQSGGGLDLAGNTTVSDSTISDNRAGAGGGGLSIISGTLTINRSVISGNRANTYGGGMFTFALTTINNSTISANLASYPGGGIFNSKVLKLNNSTISANSSTHSGGGLFSQATAELFHVTIAGNIADSTGQGGESGGGLLSDTGATTRLWNSLLTENFIGDVHLAGSDCGGPVVSFDYNYIEVPFGCALSGAVGHNLSGFDDRLGDLGAFGGPTPTRPLLPGSRLLNQIPPALCRDSDGAAPVPDQRGVARPVAGLCDMGAFEGVYDPGMYNRNLVRNGDAENGGASPTGIDIGTPQWSDTGEFTATPYDIGSGYPDSATDELPANRGYHFFSGGEAASSTGSQIIALSIISDAVDAGQVNLVISADLGGYSNQTDSALFKAIFQDQSAFVIGTPVEVGPVTAGDRGNQTGFIHVSDSAAVPVGARFITLQVIQTAGAVGTFNDGYADNLSLILIPDLEYLFLPFLTR